MPRYTRELEIRNRLLTNRTTLEDLRAALSKNGIKPANTQFKLIQDVVTMEANDGKTVEFPFRHAVRLTYYAKARHAIDPAIKVIRSYFQSENPFPR